MRSGTFAIVILAALGLSLAGLACGGPDTGAVGFSLVRIPPGDPVLRGASLNRLFVKSVSCQVFGSAQSSQTPLAEVTVAVDPSLTQEWHQLEDIPKGVGYFGRIRGFLDDGITVYECAVAGPFELKGGDKKHIENVVILLPPALDPGCDNFCQTSADCAAGYFCPCGRDGAVLADCKQALCTLFVIGNNCVVKEDCGSGLSCVTAGNFTGGYCSRSCSDDSFCPDGSWCAPKELAGIPQKLCAKSCTLDADCRTAEGYACIANPDNTSMLGCLPTTP